MSESNEPNPPQPPAPSPKKADGGIAVAQIIGAILLLIVIVFILENTRTVTMRLLIPEVKVSLAVALLIAALLGAIGTLLLQLRRKRRRK